MVRAFVIVIVLVCAQPVFVVVGHADAPSPEIFAVLDSVPDRMAACATAQALEGVAEPAVAIAALQADITCLRDLAGEIAQTFYPGGAFGNGRGAGLNAALDRANVDLWPVFLAIQTAPLACQPNCDSFYMLQAYDMNVRFLQTLIVDMTERLKDDSPVHTE